jgi:hypothetical protein
LQKRKDKKKSMTFLLVWDTTQGVSLWYFHAYMCNTCFSLLHLLWQIWFFFSFYCCAG